MLEGVVELCKSLLGPTQGLSGPTSKAHVNQPGERMVWGLRGSVGPFSTTTLEINISRNFLHTSPISTSE